MNSLEQVRYNDLVALGTNAFMTYNQLEKN